MEGSACRLYVDHEVPYKESRYQTVLGLVQFSDLPYALGIQFLNHDFKYHHHYCRWTWHSLQDCAQSHGPPSTYRLSFRKSLQPCKSFKYLTNK